MMNKELHVLSSAELSSEGVFNNGSQILKLKSTETEACFKECYKELGLTYPKFFKMDMLCKPAYLCSEVLLNTLPLTDIDKLNTGIVLYNCHSSIDTDISHQSFIQDPENFFPSPGVFVYTLPNIMLGEICIRHGIKGENLCLITQEFNEQEALQQVHLMIASGMQKVILGWVDYFNDSFKAWMVLISINGNAPNISQLSGQFLQQIHNPSSWKNS